MQVRPALSALRPQRPAKPKPAAAALPNDPSIIDCAAYVDGHRVPGCSDPATAIASVRDSGAGFVWVGLYEPELADMNSVAEVFGIHELAVEDAVHAHQRPKLERYPNSLALALKTVRYVDHESSSTAVEIVETGEIMMFLGRDFIVTVRHGQHSGLAGLRRDLETRPDQLARGPAAVMHAIADRIVDKYLAVVEAIEDDIDEMETAVFSPSQRVAIEQIYLLKREILELRRCVTPLVMPLRALAGEPHPMVPAEVRQYFRDVEDHLTVVSERVNTFDEVLTTLVSAALTAMTTQQNEDMRKISAWAAIALVPTAIAGVYGMNFEHIPGASSPLGFAACVLLMVLVCTLLYVQLRRRRWL